MLSSLFDRTAVRARRKWLLAAWLAGAWLAGIYLVLAIPVTIPGGAVEWAQANLVNLNFGVLLLQEPGSLLVVLLLGVGLGAALLALVAFLANRQLEPAAPPARRWAWMLYAIPMLIAWGLYLLAFWPAMMAPDSINQWTQASTGSYETGHPLLHTLYIGLLMQVGRTPSFVALAQIFLLAGVTAWGLGALRRHGLPNWAAWGMALLFALSPVNGTMVISIWKDTPYSIAVFALSLMMLTLALDAGRLRRKGTGLALGLVLIGVGLFRHNGLIIVPVALLACLAVYPARWKTFAAAGAIFLVVFAVVQGPLQNLLEVRKSSIITATIPLHHIAAHLHSGVQPSEEERALLEQIMPLDRWVYDCYNVNLLQGDPTLNEAATLRETDGLYELMARYFLLHPTTDINHTLCAGSLVYRVRMAAESYMLTAQLSYFPEQGYRYIRDNALGFTESPRLPWLHERLAGFVTWTSYRENNWLWWRPATYLYLLLLVGAVLMVRARSWKLGLFLLPALAQSAGLLLTNISQSFRYQYPVYLIGLFALALLFLPRQRRTKEGE